MNSGFSCHRLDAASKMNRMSNLDLNQKHCLITGVSSGLGHGLARFLLDSGARVAGCSRRIPDDLSGPNFTHLAIDLADSREGPTKLAAWLESGKRWNLVILNAGILGSIRDLADTPLEDLRRIMEVNVWSNKWILDTIFSRSSAVDQVVAISSGASQSGNRGWNGYAISKAALNMLVGLYAKEQEGAHFSALAPGLIESAMIDYLCSLEPDPRYPALETLRRAQGTPDMQKPGDCARRILSALPKLRALPSGSYADIRSL